MNLPEDRREARYGMPAADQIVYNRFYILGYSYYFRQAKWALEIINPENPILKRKDNFRPDYRIPEIFRPELDDYKNSGFHRGHLVASANQIGTKIQNSETFLLSNMAPQVPNFNSGIWKQLEISIRELDKEEDILETYVISGPIFDFSQGLTTVIGDNKKENDVSIPVPHFFFKSVLTEKHTGRIQMYSFMIPNQADLGADYTKFLVPTSKVEQYAGIFLWQTLVGSEMKREKNKKVMWK